MTVPVELGAVQTSCDHNEGSDADLPRLNFLIWDVISPKGTYYGGSEELAFVRSSGFSHV